MKELADKIREKKPNISESTIKTYVSLLKSLYYKHHEKDSPMNVSWFNNQDEIIKLLNDKDPKSRKTTYASIIAICDDKHNEKYKKAMMDDGKTYQAYIETQTKSVSQDENWKTMDDINAIYNVMFNKVKNLLNSKDPLDKNDYKKLQNFIILCVTCGKFMPPRRSTDWTEMRIRGDIDKTKENYIDKGDFVFNRYKTGKFYGEQRVAIPKDLKTILTKYIKLNPHDYLLNDMKGNKMNNVKLNQHLNSIFDGKVSTSLLRHIYLSDKLKDIPKLADLQKTAKEMGHSVTEALEYVKH
jgi:integrase